MVEIDENKSGNKVNLWNWVYAICTVIFVFFSMLKLYSSAFQIDLASLLSIILAVFSIGLSAAFYFKATDTSNRFYQNTYIHSKDIATLLAKIESGFGEKLNNLNSNYNNVRDLIQNTTEKKEEINDEMERKNEEIEEIKSSKDKIINDLIDRTNLAEQDREKIKMQLKNKDESLKKAQNNISNLESKLARLNSYNPVASKGRKVEFDIFFTNVLVPLLLKNKDGTSNDPSKTKPLERRLKELLEDGELGIDFVFEAVNRNLFTFDGTILSDGWNYIQRILAVS